MPSCCLGRIRPTFVPITLAFPLGTAPCALDTSSVAPSLPPCCPLVSQVICPHSAGPASQANFFESLLFLNLLFLRSLHYLEPGHRSPPVSVFVKCEFIEITLWSYPQLSSPPSFFVRHTGKGTGSRVRTRGWPRPHTSFPVNPWASCFTFLNLVSDYNTRIAAVLFYVS